MHEKNILTTNMQREDFELFVVMQVEILVVIDTNPRSQVYVQQQSKNPCARIIKKGNNKRGNITELMYIFPVYLHPEFWGQFWSPALRAKVVALEKIR